MTGFDGSQHPPFQYPDYKSSLLRGPDQPLQDLRGLYAGGRQSSLAETRGSLSSRFSVAELAHDLTRNASQGGEPIGERIVIAGRVLDRWGKPVAGALLEVWQANSSGRYGHRVDQHQAPLDPNFAGVGRTLSDRDGRYRFYSIKPGAYPWQNHPNAWRPQHIHFSVLANTLDSRLVTQMYFPGDPLLEFDPIFQAVPAAGRERLIGQLDLAITEADFALGYHFDIVLGGTRATPTETGGEEG